MNELLAARKMSEAARVPCFAYWLLICLYLLVQIFPVNDFIEVSGFHPASSTTIVLIECDDPALPVEPLLPPILPRVAEIIPICGPVSHVKKHFKAEISVALRAFDPRGPPLSA